MWYDQKKIEKWSDASLENMEGTYKEHIDNQRQGSSLVMRQVSVKPTLCLKPHIRHKNEGLIS